MTQSKANQQTRGGEIQDGSVEATDVVVVGAGLAGLIAAIKVAETGNRVVLLDRHDPGGRARSTRTDGGFCLNRGPHALYADQALHRQLTALGIEVRGASPSLQGAQGLVDDRLGLLPGSPSSLARSNLLPGRAKIQMATALTRIGRIEPASVAGMTVDAWLDSLDLHPSVRQLIAALVRLTTYSADHDLASADMAVRQIQLGTGAGVLYLDDGWQQMVDGLVATATERGVEIRTGVTLDVRSIKADQAQSIEAQSIGDRSTQNRGALIAVGDQLRASAVVVAGLGPAQAAALVEGAVDPSEAAGPAIEAATYDVGVSGLGGHSFVLGIDEPLYLSRHSPPASLAPVGQALYSGARYLRVADRHDHEETAERLHRLALQAGIDPAAIVETRYSHRLVVTHGQPLAEHGGLVGRPGIDALAVPGVFVAGDWVGPDGLLADASAASAERAAGAATAHVVATRAASHAAAGSEPAPAPRVGAGADR